MLKVYRIRYSKYTTDWRSQVSNPVKEKGFFLPQIVQTGCGAQKDS
jgi:hypothetical protein